MLCVKGSDPLLMKLSVDKVNNMLWDGQQSVPVDKSYFFNDFVSLLFPIFKNGFSNSIGRGKIVVELFSDAISVSVCK